MNDPPEYESSEKEQLRARAQAALDEVHALQRKVQDMSESMLRRLLGDRLEVMRESRDATVAAFSDPDPKIRQGAFSLIADGWAPDPASEDLYRRVASSDPSMNVRAAALSCLVGLYRGSCSTEISKLLANVVRNPDNSPPLRGLAYVGLLDVQGLPASNALKLALLKWKEDSSPPIEIDWRLVDAAAGLGTN